MRAHQWQIIGARRGEIRSLSAPDASRRDDEGNTTWVYPEHASPAVFVSLADLQWTGLVLFSPPTIIDCPTQPFVVSRIGLGDLLDRIRGSEDG